MSEANDAAPRDSLLENITALVGDDPELLAKATPQYPPGGKRMLLDNGNWLQRSGATTSARHGAIREITAGASARSDGDEYAADVLIYGTGFQANRFLFPMPVKGRDGVDLHAHWDGDPRAYLGITIPGFPNFFCLYGPNTNIVVNGSIVFFSECEVHYVLGCLEPLLRDGHAAMECKARRARRLQRADRRGNLGMAWGAPDVRSWYKNDKGRVTQNWPFTLLEYWNQTREPDPADYTFLTPAPERALVSAP